ncbi:AraC family transcriptional regulator N-terminal domain-containing protein [Sulfitobacter sp.]|uniref:AraC family transcriptional regulator N-terminal domain-containing protein n=1 Tax=Sulfitobacter sp. TaxID=1903071 RepID=UPI002681847B
MPPPLGMDAENRSLTRVAARVSKLQAKAVNSVILVGKETIFDGLRYVNDSSEDLCCPTSMPMEAGTPTAPAENPLYDVYNVGFLDALLRLVQLGESAADVAILGNARLRELYSAILEGEAGAFALEAFAAGNAVAGSIAYMSSRLDVSVSIDDMAGRAGMRRAMFHRKFNQATMMSSIHFV